MFFGRILLVFLSAIWLSSCTRTPPPDGPELQLRASSFDRLPNWNQDAHVYALRTFLRSCPAIEARRASDWFGPSERLGRVRAWQEACGNASVVELTNFAAKEFFEANFRPYAVVGEGTFTGYYEVEVRASRTRTAAFSHPVYAKPNDLRRNVPYHTRAQIDAGALAGRGLELMYFPTAADAFLLHVQGSGAIELTDGTRTRLSYAGNNGHDFRSISTALAAAGYDASVEGATMSDYRRWLTENPDKAIEVIQANPRFIFFTETDGAGPVGAQGVELTAGRSLAVDDAYLAYGIPIYLDTRFADPNQNDARQTLRRLMVAQDTGAAITGMVRGDFFWGTGDEALRYAGQMKEKGRYTLLLPR